MKISVLTSRDEVSEIENDWRDLYENCDERTPFLSYDWVITSINSFFSESELKIITMRNRQNKLIAAIPMVINKKKVLVTEFKVLSHLGSKAADFSGVLIASDCCKRDVIKKIVQAIILLEFDIIHIDNLSSSSKISNLLIKFIKEGNYNSGCYVNVVNPILDYDESHYEDKKQSKDIDRRLKKLSLDHDVDIRIQEKITEKEWDKLVDFHSKSFPNRGFNSKEYQSFYRELLKNSDFSENSIDFSYLLVDGIMVAGHFGFQDSKKGHFYYYVPSYDDAYNKYGIGKILLKEIIQHYQKNGFKCFDFLRGAEAYKKIWMTDELQNYSLFGCKSDSNLFVKTYCVAWLLAKQLKFFLR